MTSTLQATLAHPGATAYVVYFDQHNAGKPVWTTMVDNGTVKHNGKATITLTEDDGSKGFQGLNGGKIYIIIQSATNPVDLNTKIKVESDINWDTAKADSYRYDSFEVTLENGPNDKGNLTSVNGFGIPMELSVTYQDNTTATLGYKDSAADFVQKIATATGETVETFASGPLSGHYREVMSPAVSLAEGSGPFKASDWNHYIKTLQTADTGIEIAGFFNGSADAEVTVKVHNEPVTYGGIWHNSGFFAYTLEWDQKAKVFWLSPDESSQIKGFIQLTKADLANSIYSTLGNVGIYETKTSAEPYMILDHQAVTNSNGDAASMNSGENNQWGNVLTQFITGFSAGYYNQTGKSLNSEDKTHIDLNKNWNWDPTYAFGQHLSSSGPTHQDDYSEVFYFNSNSYGSNYSDNLMGHYTTGGPLMSMSDPGTNENVKAINLTLFDDSETPTGYVKPTIANYIDATYLVPTALSTNSVGLNLANATVVVADGTKITLDILTGYDGQTPTWATVEFKTAGSLWQTWNIIDNGGTYSAHAAGGTLPAGQMLITNFPGTEVGTYWFRLTIGEGASAKTFNLYTAVAESGSGQPQFLNPVTNPNSDTIAVDGLATIAPQSSTANTIETFNVNLLYSSTTAIAPDYLVYNTSSIVPQPNAPVAGTLHGKDFTALAGQTSQVSNVVTTDEGHLAFGWTGENNDANTRAWISGYTNKTGAQNFAEINFVNQSGPKVAPIHTQADIDGQWLTAAKALGNGTYAVTMKEYQSFDTKLKHEIGLESSRLTLTVNAHELELRPADGRTALRLAPDDEETPGGNWVTLSVDAASEEIGATVLVYLIDRQGNPVDPLTLESGVSIEDAAVARLGAHRHDDGTLMLYGSQTAYLPTDLRFAFVSLADDGTPDTGPEARVTAADAGAAMIEVGGFTIHAETDNTLSHNAVLASAQRTTGAPFVYLESGDHIGIDATGSTPHENHLAFVRVDVNTATGEWSVDGVPFSERRDFQAAVRDNLDGGHLITGVGTFEESAIWTVAGESGFYAPVLISPVGKVIVSPRSIGDNTFAFNDRPGRLGTDTDFNDMTARLTYLQGTSETAIDRVTDSALVLDERTVVLSGTRFVSTFDGDNGMFAGEDYGLAIVGGTNGTGNLAILGSANFRGGSEGILIENGPAIVSVRDGGRLAVSPGPGGEPGIVLGVSDTGGPVTLRNDGTIIGTIALGDGDDVVSGAGRFKGPIDTGAGDDRVIYDGPVSIGPVSLGSGDDIFRNTGNGSSEVDGGLGDDRLRGGSAGDDMIGGAGNDDQRGGAGRDHLFGEDGDDRLFGEDGRDFLIGGDGMDALRGGNGGDSLFGGTGADVMHGGLGDDEMSGGTGADLFLTDLFNGSDVIFDFENGSDRINLQPFGLSSFGTDVAPALSNAGGGATRLDMGMLGGSGELIIAGLSLAAADAGDFIL